MGRIAYLSKRGKIWWFRRRHPAIFTSNTQSADFIRDFGTNGHTVQAKGHLAVSLRTSSSREARVLAARMGDHFERAWAAFETKIGQMTETPSQDILDQLTQTLAKGFRNYITHYRQAGVAAMAPELRERVFAIIDAELRESLGVAPLPYDDMFKRTKPAPIKYIVKHPPAPEDIHPEYEEWVQEMAEEYGDFAASEDAITDHLEISQSRIIDADDSDGVARIENIAEGLDFLVQDFVDNCEREGRVLNEELPSAIKIAESLHAAALRLGLPKQKPLRSADAPRRQYSDEPFSKFAAAYLKLRCKGFTLRREDETSHEATGAAFERSSLRNWQSSVRVFTEIVGDLPLSKIGKEDVREFNEMIQQLPANFGRSSKDTRNAREVIEASIEKEVEDIENLSLELGAAGTPPNEVEDKLAAARVRRLSATTVKRHQTALHSILEYATSRQLIASNAFKGRMLTDAEVKRRKKTERRVQRMGWGGRIDDLFKTKIFQEPLDDIGEPLFWAPLIAVYAGLRLQEVCQLRVNDFGKQDNVLYSSVQNELGTQLAKSENSFRTLPIHKALVDLGLPQLVAIRKQSGMSRLFPDLSISKSKGTLSANMSKRFGYYRHSQGLDEPGLDFHALRTEFQVRLTRAKVPDHVRKGLMGHEQTDTTHTHYFRAGEKITDLKEYIDRNDIDHSVICPPFGTRFITEGRHNLRVVS